MNLNYQQRLILLWLVLLLNVVAGKPNNDTAIKIEKVEPEYTLEEKIELTLGDHQKAIAKSENPICYRGLVRAYGLEGLFSPSAVRLDVCPGIDQSCCTAEDQLHIIDSIEKDRQNYKARLDRQSQIISNLLDQMKILGQIGSRMKGRLASRRLSNCKVLLARFSFFEIDEIAEEINKTMKEMHDFLQTSYKGFFCTICDATKHIYFNANYKVAVLSYEFCRQMMSSSIKVLRYLHVHLAKYANYAAHFAGFCDITGKFIDEPIDAELKFDHSKAQKDISKCWEGRNQPFWVYDCQEFCQNFSPIKQQEFFEPYIKKYMLITRYLEKRNKELLFQESREPLLNLPESFKAPQTKSIKSINKERVLSETKSVNSTNQTATNQTNTTQNLTAKTQPAEPEKPAEEQEVPAIDYTDTGIRILIRGNEMREVIGASFSVAMSGKEGAPFDLVEYVAAFHERGLNFYEAGKTTTSNMDLYMEIRDKIKKDQAPEATDDGSTRSSEKTRRRLKSASILTTLFALVSVLVLF